VSPKGNILLLPDWVPAETPNEEEECNHIMIIEDLILEEGNSWFSFCSSTNKKMYSHP